MKKIILFSLLFFIARNSAFAQNISALGDSLDGKFDMSDWVLTAHGFIPVPVLITEPALGGIGGALIPVFITRNPPYTYSLNGKVVTERVRPNLYALGGAYTANGTWLVAAASTGVIKKWRSHYRLATGFANVNLNFYREIPGIGEKSFEFNIQTWPVYAQLIKQFKHSSWYYGINYLFLKTELKRSNTDFHNPEEIKKNVSRAGILIEYDHRDNIFTPDKGFRWNTLFATSDDFIGSDYNYQMANSSVFYYLPFTSTFIAGFRAEYQEAWGNVPFYLVPFINMRGIPIARYQGDIVCLAESELRWDFTSRWSLIGFGGAGKAVDEWNNFNEADWHASGGFGGRYLIARKLNLRMGIDIARGPEQWAYYMVFGTSWVK